MCGIVGYIGHRKAYPYLIEGLKKLEYRGYDSAGIALHQGDSINIIKKTGKVGALEEATAALNTETHLGIGHTRWATHGAPSDRNAHPHLSQSGRYVLVHNGIIENFAALRAELLEKDYTFQSDTDSEVLLNYIEYLSLTEGVTLEEAMRRVLSSIRGAYVILVMDKEDANTLYAARKGSPLVIGIGDGEYFLASDATPLLAYTRKVTYIEDNQLAIIRRDNLIIKDLHHQVIEPTIQQLTMELESIEKANYAHFMLKEIYEQPKALQHALRERLVTATTGVKLEELNSVAEQLQAARRIIIIGCGTSWHAGLLAEYWIEELARIPVEVEYGSEFRYRNPIITSHDVIIAISQSGETADTLVALKKAKSMGATVIGVVNVVGSSIARIADASMYTHAGPEIGVASTKAFMTQLGVLSLLALHLGTLRATSDAARTEQLTRGILALPQQLQTLLDEQVDNIQRIARTYASANNFLFLGRGYNFPIALEGALKLKEISYIHAEGYPAAEMKHGPLALVDETMPVVCIATRDSVHEKVINNMQEIKARSGLLIAIVSAGDSDTAALADDYIEVPATDEILAPILSTLPMQLLSYYIALDRGCHIDMPRNLAKSVTVE